MTKGKGGMKTEGGRPRRLRGTEVGLQTRVEERERREQEGNRDGVGEKGVQEKRDRVGRKEGKMKKREGKREDRW